MAIEQQSDQNARYQAVIMRDRETQGDRERHLSDENRVLRENAARSHLGPQGKGERDTPPEEVIQRTNHQTPRIVQMSTLPQTSNAEVSRANLLNQNPLISPDLSSHQSMQQTPQQPAFGDPGRSVTHREENGNGYGQSGNGYGRGQSVQERGENRYHKIPNELCTKFGEKVETTRDFNTFEREFSTVCRLQAVPDHQKLDRLVVHLEGAILKHATCWLDEREDQDTQYV
ncbi:MAG: hypothetical protein GY820_35590, partial [Gammaproteobacteria bacterium]|nr:hypothetical protein [Gammaproteobacteria bacterium]